MPALVSVIFEQMFAITEWKVRWEKGSVYRLELLHKSSKPLKSVFISFDELWDKCVYACMLKELLSLS